MLKPMGIGEWLCGKIPLLRSSSGKVRLYRLRGNTCARDRDPKTVRPARLGSIRVSLPDRRTSPYSFEGRSLQARLDDAARPQSTLLPLLAAYVS